MNQTQSDLQEILDRLNAIKINNQIFNKKIVEILNLMETRVHSSEDDIVTIKNAINRIETRYRGNL